MLEWWRSGWGVGKCKNKKQMDDLTENSSRKPVSNFLKVF